MVNSKESILSEIEEIDNQIKILLRHHDLLESQVEKLYYVRNICIDGVPLIICHGTEKHCRQYMIDKYPDGLWYFGGNQFSPIDNPKQINWAILSSVSKVKMQDWDRVQSYISNPNRETENGLIAMWRG